MTKEDEELDEETEEKGEPVDEEKKKKLENIRAFIEKNKHLINK